MYSRFHIVMIASILLLVIFIVVAFFTLQRQTGFTDNSEMVGRTNLNATAHQISAYIRNLQDRVQFFTEEHQADILYLAKHADDDDAVTQMRTLLERRFPEYSAFTITDSHGEPLLADFEALIGELCTRDLEYYARLIVSRSGSYRNQPAIHPQPGNYHFDIMAFWQDPSQASNLGGVFFVSFHADGISHILRDEQLSDHQLLLVRENEQNMIEIAAEGTRDKLTREPRLSSADRDRISQSRDVGGTAWRLLLLPDDDLEARYQQRIWRDALIILAAAVLLTSLLLWLSAWHHRRKHGHE